MKNKILIGLLGIGILAVGTLAVSQKPAPGNGGVTPPAVVPPAVIPLAPTSTTPPDYEELSFPDNHLDTSDWLTYRNEEFGFEVKYPKGWGVDLLDYGGPSQKRFLGQLVLSSPDIRNTDNDLTVFYLQDLSLDEQIQSVMDNGIMSLKIKRKIRVNNVYGIEYGSSVGNAVVGNIIIAASGNTFLFYPHAEKHSFEIQKILLSFKSLR